MWLLLQQETPDDYVISSGKSISLKEIVHYVFDKLNLDHGLIRINPKLFRPTEIEDIYGTSEKARTRLQWKYDLDFSQVLDKIIEEEQLNYAKA